MRPEKWLEIKDKVKEKFKILEQYDENNEERREEKQVIIFEGPLGLIKLEYIKRPVVLDKKTNYSRRIGGMVEVDYIYSEDEFSYTLKTFIFDQPNQAWQEIKAHNFTL